MTHDTEIWTILVQLERNLALEPCDLASAIGATRRTVERWRSGDAYLQRDARQRLTDLIDLDQHLHETFMDQDAVHGWLIAENRYLGGVKPIEALKAGRIEGVKAALETLDSGVFL